MLLGEIGFYEHYLLQRQFIRKALNYRSGHSALIMKNGVYSPARPLRPFINCIKAFQNKGSRANEY